MVIWDFEPAALFCMYYMEALVIVIKIEQWGEQIQRKYKIQ